MMNLRDRPLHFALTLLLAAAWSLLSPRVAGAQPGGQALKPQL